MVCRLEKKLIYSIDDCATFAQKDLFRFMREIGMKNDILYIHHFEIEKEHRNKGLGSEFLKLFCEQFKYNFALFLTAGIPVDDEEELTDEEVKARLLRLERFYTNVGFVNVNEKIGEYESKISFLYGSGIGENIIKALK